MLVRNGIGKVLVATVVLSFFTRLSYTTAAIVSSSPYALLPRVAEQVRIKSGTGASHRLTQQEGETLKVATKIVLETSFKVDFSCDYSTDTISTSTIVTVDCQSDTASCACSEENCAMVTAQVVLDNSFSTLKGISELQCANYTKGLEGSRCESAVYADGNPSACAGSISDMACDSCTLCSKEGEELDVTMDCTNIDEHVFLIGCDGSEDYIPFLGVGCLFDVNDVILPSAGTSLSYAFGVLLVGLASAFFV